MTTSNVVGQTHHQGKLSLPLIDLEAELKTFEAEERKRLGLDTKTEQWIEQMAGLTFTKREKTKITLLVGGLTMAHDYFVEAALHGVGYHVQMLDVPTNEGLQVGKEFGNRGQCNPTYFTVGNLVKYLITLREKHGLTSQEIVEKYVFLTAGACGPCRFGMYVTEYRKALRDAGFDGFRVVLFQQTGGLKQATGEESGLELNPAFFWALVKAIVAGDVINALGYRLRPYEVTVGDTDRAIEQCKKIIYTALEDRTNIMAALWECKPIFGAVNIDRTVAKPKVSIIGEFWAMTTEGDGNYQLQRFLEGEGAEVDVQLVTAWLLYTVWEGTHDTKDRMNLRGADKAKYGLGSIDGDVFGVAKKLAALNGAAVAIRVLFQTFAHAAGLYGYKLPNMEEIASISHEYYNNDLRGGEGHMEVGKLIMNTIHSKAHMTLSVKPFGCMPSAGVSDGVQSAITEKFPGVIYCPVETSGDGRVNFYSRVQMYLFKAKQVANAEYSRALEEHDLTRDQVKAFLDTSPRFASALFKAAHSYAGVGADVIAAVAPYIKQTRLQRWKDRVTGVTVKSRDLAQRSPDLVIKMVRGAVEAAPEVVEKIKFDATLFVEATRASRAAKAKAKAAPVAYDVAAE